MTFVEPTYIQAQDAYQFFLEKARRHPNDPVVALLLCQARALLHEMHRELYGEPDTPETATES